MTVRMGQKLAELGGHVLADPRLTGWLARINRQETPGTYPVAQGLVCAALGPRRPTPSPRTSTAWRR